MLLLLPWAVALILVHRHHHLDSGAVGIATALSVGLPTLWVTWAAYRDAKQSGALVGGLTMAQVADQLAVAVGAQWKNEAAERRLHNPYPLPVSWIMADTSLTDTWDSLVKLATSGAGWPSPPSRETWATGPDRLAGKGGELASVLARVPTGRLVVLGEPGAGKTMLMVRLVLDLLARRAEGDPVPFLTSVASWDPTTQDLWSWLSAQLQIDHPALASPSPEGRTELTRAETLLASALVLPILDGLDEIPEQVRGPAISRINLALRPGEQIVVTCRSKEYRDAVRPEGGAEVTLRGAAAVELRPLAADVVRGYVVDDAAGPLTKARWDPVLALLGTAAPAGQALRTPLMVGLACAIYNPRPDELVGALRDPAELCSPALTDQAAVESLQFDAFIPAAYRSDPTGRWKAHDAERWLVFLARHLEHTIASPDLAWWQMRKAASRLARTTAMVSLACTVVALVGAVLGVVLESAFRSVFLEHVWAIVFLAFVLAFAILACISILSCVSWLILEDFSWLILDDGEILQGFEGPGLPQRIHLLPLRHRNVVFGAAVAVGMCVLGWIGAGALEGILIGILSWPAAGFAHWFSDLREAGVTTDVSSAVSPQTVLAMDCRTGITLGAVYGVAVGGMAGLLIWAFEGIVLGIVGGAGVGLFIVVCVSCTSSVWLSYGIAQVWLALRGQLPLRLMGFLDDAHRKGVLRQVGSVYQFKHIELQHRLANRSGKMGDYLDVRADDESRCRAALIKVIDPAQSVDQYAIPGHAKRFVRTVIKIKTPGIGVLGKFRSHHVTLLGGNGETYPAKYADFSMSRIQAILDRPVKIADFNTSLIQMMFDKTVIAAVTFQVPDGVEVKEVQWNAERRFNSAARWDAHS